MSLIAIIIAEIIRDILLAPNDGTGERFKDRYPLGFLLHQKQYERRRPKTISQKSCRNNISLKTLGWRTVNL